MRLLFVPLLFLQFYAVSQVVLNTVKHDFGDLESFDNRFVDITLTNTGVKQEYILRIKKDMEVVYISTSQFIEPGMSTTLRFQVNPTKKGKFNFLIDVYTSDRQNAQQIKLSGNLKELPDRSNGGLTACPDFGAHPANQRPNDFDLTVITIDRTTKEELGKTSVSMIQNGRTLWSENTDLKGKIRKGATLGLSYFYASHEGYLPAELGAYVNRTRDVVVLELDKDPNYQVEPPIQPEEKIYPIDVIELEHNLEEELSAEVILPEDSPKELSELNPNDFDANHFTAINVVFVLDVSGSMKQGEKVELMKYSLFQLTDMLRPEDKMGIVTYASTTKVLLSPVSGSNKDAINKEIEKLKAEGLTAGGKGIKVGYKETLKTYLDGGVNHVIVITDGAFNKDSDDYQKYVKKYKKKGINLSIVGIQNKPNDEEKMKEAAALGGGTYIPIHKLADAQNNLKQAIRVLTFRK